MKRLFSLLPVLAILLPAQEFRSTLTGRVLDPSGAAVPNAKLQITNSDTATHFEAVSTGEGSYTVPFLAPGPYEIRVEVAGFKTYVHSGIKIQTGATVTEDVRLEVGSTSESVIVQADAPLIEAATATSGQVLTTQEVENLPSNGRSPIGFVRQEYGVIPKQKHALAEVRPFDNSGGGDFSLGGGNASSNEILLNGVPNMQDSSRTAGFSPFMDAVDEIRSDQFESNAAYGDTSGGTVNITTKSGTNQFHGTLSEFNETSALAAGLFFNNANNIPNPVTRQNQYGGTIGGPVLIPRLYNGRNKLFFFYAYEGFKDSSPSSVFATVPTAAERNGDFSALLALGKTYQLYNPYSGVLSGGKVTRQPFAGNVIATSLLNPVALNYLSYYPQPNLPGKADGEQNFISTTPTVDNYFSNMGRMDYNVTDTNKLFFDVHQSHWLQTSANTFQNIATGTNTNVDMWGGVLDDVHTFSPTLVLDARLGFSRTENATSLLPSVGFDASTLGFPSYIRTNSTLAVLPRIVPSECNSCTAFATLGGKTGSPAYFDTIQLFATLTKIWGNHTFKVGPDMRANKLSQIGSGYSSGSFTFGSTWVTSGTGAQAQPFGSSFASLLLGLPTAGQYDINEPTTSNNFYYAAFIQDDWKIKRNLTLNLGLRIEHETPIVESNNRQTIAFNPTAVNSATQPAQAAYAAIYAKYAAANPLLPSISAFQPTGGLIFATPSNRSGYSTAAAMLSPRIGIAWAPGKFGNKTVFRGGFGIYFNPFNDYNTGPSTGFSQTTPFVPTNNNYLTPATTLTDPFPAGNGIQQPPGSSLGVNTYLWNDVAFYTPNPKNPYSERWSFDVQHQFSKDLMMDIGYIGAHQVNLSYSNCLSSSNSSSSCNGIPPVQYLSRLPGYDAALTKALANTVPNPFGGLLPGIAAGSTTSVASLLGPYPEFTGVTQKLVPGGYAWFHMLAVRVTKRFSSGLQFNINYEHSRQLGTTQLQGGGPLVYTETTSDFPDHFVLTGSYNLPFGRGTRFLSNANRFVNALVGGWTLNAIYMIQSGAPIQWGNVIYYGGPLHYNPTNLTQAFDVTQFNRNSTDQPNTYNYRTFPQLFNNLRSQGANNADLSMLKNFALWERVRLQYRFEAFNALNRTQFDAANVGPTSSTFGTITKQANSARAIQMGLRLQF